MTFFKKIFFFGFFFIIFVFSCVYSSSKQGVYITEDKIIKKKIAGVARIRMPEFFGDPMFMFLDCMECVGYYYLYVPDDPKFKTRRHCVLFFFHHDVLYESILYF